MRLIVHDYSGHPFQLQLSRELASRGHEVEHQFCPSYSTGKGAVERNSDDPDGFSVAAVPMRGTFARYSAVRRLLQEVHFGLALGRRWRGQRPDVVVMCNIPLIANYLAARLAHAAGIPLVFWHQDVYSHAIATAARRRLPSPAGGAAARLAEHLEAWVARHSQQVVVITKDFLDVHHRWGVDDAVVTVIPNWAPIAELPSLARRNPWSVEQGLAERPTVLYSGTLGLKHDPSVLRAMAQRLQHDLPEAVVVVVSEGQGRQWLEDNASDSPNLVLLDYQPYERLPEVLAGADVLVTVLEPDASRYSVPSKVLTYLCSGRPVLGVLPRDNAAATMIASAGAGVVTQPGDPDAAADQLVGLLGDRAQAASMGRAARAFAEEHFQIGPLGQRFEDILMRSRARHHDAPAIEPGAL